MSEREKYELLSDQVKRGGTVSTSLEAEPSRTAAPKLQLEGQLTDP